MGHTINPQYQKSTLSAYTDTELTSNQEAIPFNTIDILTGCSIKTTAGSTEITLANPGIYEVIFNAQAASGATSPVPVGVQLYNNGVAVTGAESVAQPADSGYLALAITKLIKVKPSCPMVNNNAVLTFVTTADDTLIDNANVTVIKIC
jgi:hypothetical protein